MVKVLLKDVKHNTDKVFEVSKEAFILNEHEKMFSDAQLKKYIRKINLKSAYGLLDIIPKLMKNTHSSVKMVYKILSLNYNDSKIYTRNKETFLANLSDINMDEIFDYSLFQYDDLETKIINFLIYDIGSDKFDTNINLDKNSMIYNYSFLYNFLLENKNFRFKNKLTPLEKNILSDLSKCFEIVNIKKHLEETGLTISTNDIKNIAFREIPKKLGFDNIIQVMTLRYFIISQRYSLIW